MRYVVEMVWFRSAIVLSSLVSLAACGSASTAPPSAASSGARAPSSAVWWPRLTESLTGTWSATTESGRALEVTYRVVSRGTAMVQTWAPSTPGETVTMFHPDGASLLLTHYCGQGNQARLAAVETGEDYIVFRRFEITNRGERQSALHELVIRLAADGATYEQTETYTDEAGAAETTVLVFHRTPAAAQAAPAEVGESPAT